MPGVFRVVRNPDELSTLPYLIELPLPSGPLRLKAKDTWPRTAKVYCHRADEWPADAEVVEEVAVRSCVRRGVAVDLVLDRSRENRSQIVFTTLKGGREGIFWQSARTTQGPAQGLRVPTRRSAAGQLELIVGLRERYAWKFNRPASDHDNEALPPYRRLRRRRPTVHSSASLSARRCRDPGRPPRRRQPPRSRSASWRRCRERPSWSRTAGLTSSDSSTSRRAWSPRWSPTHRSGIRRCPLSSARRARLHRSGPIGSSAPHSATPTKRPAPSISHPKLIRAG